MRSATGARSRPPAGEARTSYFEQLHASIAAFPDVVSACVETGSTPPNNGWSHRFELLGKLAPSPEAQTARVNLFDSGYFRTLQTPLSRDASVRPPKSLAPLPSSWSIRPSQRSRRHFNKGNSIGTESVEEPI